MSRAILAAALVALAALAPTTAQAREAVTVGRVTTTQTCTLYREYAGEAGVVATPWMVAAAASWRSWLVKDCVDNFASFRRSIEAALASTGKLAVGRGGYIVDAVLSQVSDGGPAERAPDMGVRGYQVNSAYMFVNLDVTLRDRSGRIIYGGLLTKRLETGASISTGGFRVDQSTGGQAVYGALQQQVALALARIVAFKIVPLVATANEGREIRLNYGSPLLVLGTTVQMTSPDGGAVIRYNVTSSSPEMATAEQDSEGDGSRIVPGSTGTVIEPEDPAHNARRFKRVELP